MAISHAIGPAGGALVLRTIRCHVWSRNIDQGARITQLVWNNLPRYCSSFSLSTALSALDCPINRSPEGAILILALKVILIYTWKSILLLCRPRRILSLHRCSSWNGIWVVTFQAWTFLFQCNESSPLPSLVLLYIQLNSVSFAGNGDEYAGVNFVVSVSEGGDTGRLTKCASWLDPVVAVGHMVEVNVARKDKALRMRRSWATAWLMMYCRHGSQDKRLLKYLN